MLHTNRDKDGFGKSQPDEESGGTATASRSPSKPTGRSLLPVGLAVIGLAVAAVIGFAVMNHGANEPTAMRGSGQRPPTPVVTTAVSEARFSDRIDIIGTAQARESIDVTSKVTEVVARVNFDDGQTVDKDDILVELTNDQQTADLAEERAALTEAERQYERIADLAKRGTSTQSQLDTAIAQRDQARARVNAMEAQLADRLIRAPFSGVLGLRHVSPGTLVKPGDLITTLDDISVIKFDFSVPEVFLSSLKPGMELVANAVPYPDKKFVGTVTAVDTRIDPDTRAVKVRAEIKNDSGLLKPGMLLTAQLESNVHSSLAVPEEALLQNEDKVFVFVVEKSDAGLTASQREIKVGRTNAGLVEVTSGLSKGEEVIVQGVNVVSPGAPVVRAEPEPADGKPPAG